MYINDMKTDMLQNPTLYEISVNFIYNRILKIMIQKLQENQNMINITNTSEIFLKNE